MPGDLMRWLATIVPLACLAVSLHGSGASAPEPITFQDIGASARIDFVLRNAVTPERHQIETMAGGVAIFDYNNDGRPDLYFVNGARQPSLDKPDPSWFNRLYRNNGDGKFTDVTSTAGVAGSGFDIGVAVAD